MTLGHYANNERAYAWLLVLGTMVSCAPTEPSPSLVHFYEQGPSSGAAPSAAPTSIPPGEAVRGDETRDPVSVSQPAEQAPVPDPASDVPEPTAPPPPLPVPATPDGAQEPVEASEGAGSSRDVVTAPTGGDLETDAETTDDPAGSGPGGSAEAPAPGPEPDSPPEAAPEPIAPPPVELQVSITTATQRGRYAPINVGAIWIENAAGDWIYTLNYWNSELNSRHMARYNSTGGPAYVRNFFLRWVTEPPPDVVTSATLDEHETHVGTWHLKDESGAAAPAGDYKVVIELTEEEAPGEVAEFPFMLGPVGMTWTPADTPYYKAIEIVLQ